LPNLRRKYAKHRLRVPQERAVRGILKQRPDNLRNILLQEIPPNLKILDLRFIAAHMSLRIGDGILHKGWIVEQTSGDNARQFVATAFVSVVEPRLPWEGVDKLLAASQFQVSVADGIGSDIID
jgi:hypothetical protein